MCHPEPACSMRHMFVVIPVKARIQSFQEVLDTRLLHAGVTVRRISVLR